jgi:hypothetical protein
MPEDRSEIAARNPVSRSAVTNGSRLLPGDGRSAGARRYRDLTNAFAAELGGMAALLETGQQLVRRLAQVSVELELLEATRAAGGAIDPVAFVTLVNSQRRLLRDLEALKREKAARTPRQSALAQYLADKTAAPQPAGEAA